MPRFKTIGIIHDHKNKTHGLGHKAYDHFEDFSQDLRFIVNLKRNTYKKCLEIFEIRISKIVI